MKMKKQRESLWRVFLRLARKALNRIRRLMGKDQIIKFKSSTSPEDILIILDAMDYYKNINDWFSSDPDNNATITKIRKILDQEEVSIAVTTKHVEGIEKLLETLEKSFSDMSAMTDMNDRYKDDGLHNQSMKNWLSYFASVRKEVLKFLNRFYSALSEQGVKTESVSYDEMEKILYVLENFDTIFAEDMKVFEESPKFTRDGFKKFCEMIIESPDDSEPISEEVDISEFINNSLQRLHENQEEQVRILESLQDLAITSITNDDDEQGLYTEQMIYESLISGPFYEKSDNPQKTEIRKTAKDIQDAIKEHGHTKYKLLPSTGITRLLGKGAVKSKAWQTVGVFYAPNGNENKALQYYRDMFKELLERNNLTLNASQLKVEKSMLHNPHIKGKVKFTIKALTTIYVTYIVFTNPFVGKLLPLIGKMFGQAKLLHLIGSAAVGSKVGKFVSSFFGKGANLLELYRWGFPHLLIVDTSSKAIDTTEIEPTEEEMKSLGTALSGADDDEKEIKEFAECMKEDSDES